MKRKNDLQEEITNSDKSKPHRKTTLYRKIEGLYDPSLSFDIDLNIEETMAISKKNKHKPHQW